MAGADPRPRGGQPGDRAGRLPGGAVQPARRGAARLPALRRRPGAAAGGAEYGAGRVGADGAGPLPQGWASAALGELVRPTRPRRDPQELPDLPFIGMGQVEAHTMRLVDTVPARTMRSSAVHFQ